MASIHIDGDHLTISLTRFEKIAGLFGDQRIPLADVREVRLENDPHRAISGLRAPGLAIPRRTKIGTWRGGGRRMFVCVRASQPAVLIETSSAGGYQAYLVSVDEPSTVVDAISGGRPGA